MKLTAEVVEKHTRIKSENFLSDYWSVKSKGGQFRVLEYLTERSPETNLDYIQAEVIKKAHKSPGSLLEAGAHEFVDYMEKSDRYFCIMTFGEPRWQTTKIIAAGLGRIQKLIVSDERKGMNIASWFDDFEKCFVLPKSCFLDNRVRKAREVVLIDDKVKAFHGLPKNARGYLLQDIARMYASEQGKVPSNVKRVNRLDDIIFHEESKRSLRYS